MEVKTVCRECNHGWMEALDREAHPLLWPLCYAQVGEVELPDGNRLLAQWAAKIGFLIDSVNPSIPQAFRTRFYESRELPKGATVRIGAMARTETEARQTGLSLRPGPETEEEQVYVATFRVLHVIFQFTCPLRPGVVAVPDSHLWSHMRQLWPPKDAITWPPPSNVWIRNELDFLTLATSLNAAQSPV